jgi:hypothetical protein
MSVRRVGGVAIVAMFAILFNAPAAMAASHRVECGQVTAYVAPDPSGPTNGQLTLGLLSPWTVAADAIVSSDVVAQLPSLVNNSPTCVEFDQDGSDVITTLAFTDHGVINGHVAYESSFDGYVLADRLMLPTSVLSSLPGLGVLFVASADAGTPLSLALQTDLANGQITGFDGHAAFCGKAHIKSGGDAVVGKATIAAAFLDPGDVARINGAGSRKVCATVESIGAVSNSGPPDIQTTVVLSVAAAAGATVTPPPTSTVDVSGTASSADGGLAVLALLTVFSVALAGAMRRRPSRSGDRAI